MATYTDNYNLIKPTMAESADIRTINGNMDSIDNILHASQVSLAPAYDANSTYNTGDVVMYEFLMYECLDDNVTGVWDATKWQRTTAGEHGGGGGGSDVEITPTLQSGTKIADFEIDGVSGALYAPSGGGGGGGVQEISWVNYNRLTPAEKSNGDAYFIPDAGADPLKYAPTGAVASFNDGSANPLVSLKIGIEPVQAGSGDPSPSNPRAISGWTGANVHVADGETPHVVDNVYTISWQTEGGTVYGGYVDWKNGKIYANIRKVILNGSQSIKLTNWRPTATSIGWLYYSNGEDKDNIFIESETLKTVTYNELYAGNIDYSIAIVSSGDYGLGVRVGDTSLTTDEAINTYLASNPITVVTRYSTPIEYTLSSVPNINSLLGKNNIWADTGDIEECGYYANITVTAPQIRQKDIIYTQNTAPMEQSDDMSDMTWTLITSTTGTSSATAIPSGTKFLVLTAELGGYVSIVAKESIANIEKIATIASATFNQGYEYADIAGNHTTISMSVSSGSVTIKSGYSTVTAKVYAVS